MPTGGTLDTVVLRFRSAFYGFPAGRYIKFAAWLKHTDSSFQGFSYYNRTGGNDDDERHIDGHTAVSDYF